MSTTHPTTTTRHAEARRIGPQSQEPVRERLLARMPLMERRLPLAGISTAVLEGGDGPPIVLLHGPGEHTGKWLRVVPDLVTSHRVIAPDLPGHGTSEVKEGPIGAQQVVAWLDALIERTCPTPPMLVGHITGGAIAAYFAARRGDRLRCLVLVDSLGLAPFAPAPEFGAALMEFIAHPSEATHDGLWQRCAFDLDRLRERMGAAWDELRAYNLDRAQMPSLRPAQQSLMEQFGFPPIPAAELSRITVPTFLIWGRHDLATPLSVAEAASIRYGWPLHVIEGAGDDPAIEQPETFVRLLSTLLDGVAATNSEAGEAPAGTREAWDRIAPGYDRTNTPTQIWLGNEALRQAGLRRGTRFLDVAAGSGALSIPAARIGAAVVAVDQSPVMLKLLEERARNEGLGIDTRIMDGHELGFEESSFDMVGSQFGVMLFPDMPRGIKEMVRVLKPGGRALVIAYGDPHEIEFIEFLVKAIQSVRPDFEGPSMEPPPLPFQLCDPERLRSELISAGLSNPRVETITENTAFKTGEELWDWIVWSNPIVEEMLGHFGLSGNERGIIRRALDQLVRKRAGGNDSAILSKPIHIGIGTK